MVCVLDREKMLYSVIENYMTVLSCSKLKSSRVTQLITLNVTRHMHIRSYARTLLANSFAIIQSNQRMITSHTCQTKLGKSRKLISLCTTQRSQTSVLELIIVSLSADRQEQVHLQCFVFIYLIRQLDTQQFTCLI